MSPARAQAWDACHRAKAGRRAAAAVAAIDRARRATAWRNGWTSATARLKPAMAQLRRRRRRRAAAAHGALPQQHPAPHHASITASRPIFIIPGLPSANSTRAACFPGSARSKRRPTTSPPSSQPVMAAERAELVPYIQYAEHLPLISGGAQQESRLDRDPSCFRMACGSTPTPRHCPKTMALLASLDQPRDRAALAQRDVLAARAEHRHPAACRGQQCPAGLPFAADRPRRLLVPGRRAKPATGRAARHSCSTTRSSMRR